MEPCPIALTGSELLIIGGVEAQCHIKLREQGLLGVARDGPQFRDSDCGRPAPGHRAV